MSSIDLRISDLANEHKKSIYVRTDRLFVVLMSIQFVAAIAAAWIISPRVWAGGSSSLHLHVIGAIIIGALLAIVPITMVLRNPGTKLNQYIISVSQLAFSGLFIHLMGGRIEAHFHIFGSLAFLSFYRDWKVLIPATLVTTIDHLARAVFWPESVFGIITAAPWRAFEHAGWVIFEDIFLIYGCVTSAKEVNLIASRRAELESTNQRIEQLVEERTNELKQTLSALNTEHDQRVQMEQQLSEAQKLESIGQLAAGIAHEINTPAQYVGDNTRFIQGEFEGLLKVMDKYASQLDLNSPKQSWEERSKDIRATLDEVDYEFIREEIPAAISQSIEGIDRITHIVKAMKDFSHPGSSTKEPANLNNAIKSTATVCSNRWKYAADIEYDLDEAAPVVPCLLGELNQVVLNLIVNAADAIESHTPEGEKGLICISTKTLESEFQIQVKDNGGGMPESVRNKIFDPFFTTKDVGKGTGQGLAISRDVIVTKHQGTLDCDTEEGVGTTFTIRLPLNDSFKASSPEQTDQADKEAA